MLDQSLSAKIIFKQSDVKALHFILFYFILFYFILLFYWNCLGMGADVPLLQEQLRPYDWHFQSYGL